jgi:hypothetical protein
VASHAFSLCRHSNFMLLNVSSGLLTGLVYALCTCIGQLMRPCGDSNDAAGVALAALAAASTVGVVLYLYMLRGMDALNPAAVAAPLVASAPAARAPYVAHQIGWSLSTCVGIGAVLAVTRSGMPQAAVVAAWALLGLLSGTLLNGALTMEHAAEMTFPLPANVSVALLSVTSSVISFAQVVVGTALLQAPSSAACSTPATPFAAFTVASAAVGLAAVALLRPEYRRAEVEARAVTSPPEEGKEMPPSAGGGYGATA